VFLTKLRRTAAVLLTAGAIGLGAVVLHCDTTAAHSPATSTAENAVGNELDARLAAGPERADIRQIETNPWPKEWEALWTDLASTHSHRAYYAVCRLVGRPKHTLPLLKKRLHPAVPVAQQRLAQLIAGLESDRTALQEQAEQELEQLGELAAPALRKALEGKPSPKARRRMELLLVKLDGPADAGTARALRSVEVLEMIGTPDATRQLEALTWGAPEAWLTHAAKAAMQRLTKRPTKR